MSNYDRRDRQDETAMWDAGEVRRQESAQQQRRGDEKRRSARRRTGTAIYLVCVVLGSCLLAGIGWLMINDLCSLNKAPVEVEITVEEGDSVSDVAKKLKDAGLVNSKGFFQLASGFLHYSRYVEPGTYKLNSDMDFRALIVNMHDWKQDSMDAQGLVQVTIPEGYTVRQIIDLLAEKGVATKAELEDACANFDFENYSFLSSDTLGSIDRMEGFLFPTTYTFDKNKTAVFAVDTMLTMFKNEISQQMLEDIKNSPYDLKQIITMASIIEKESIGDDTERKNISSVIHNRLERPNSEKGGRLLQLCSSINYIMVHDDISKFDTTIESPYNTYIHEGLTLGPSAIRASAPSRPPSTRRIRTITSSRWAPMTRATSSPTTTSISASSTVRSTSPSTPDAEAGAAVPRRGLGKTADGRALWRGRRLSGGYVLRHAFLRGQLLR